VVQEVVDRKVELPNDVTVVVDVSGSMAGGKLAAAKEGVRLLFTNVLDKRDHMSVWVFGTEARMIIHLTKKGNVDIDDVLRRINGGDFWSRMFANGTALFDAVDAAMNEMKGEKDRSLQLVVLTDGEDNSSKRVSESALATRLQKPGLAHFHLIAVAVGIEAKTNLTPLCAPRHCHLIKVDNAAAGIKKAFDTCVTTIKEIRQRVHTDVKSQKVVTDGRGNKKVEEVHQSFDKIMGGGPGAALGHHPKHLAIDDGRQQGLSPSAGPRSSSREGGDSPKSTSTRTCALCSRSFPTTYSGPDHTVKCDRCYKR